MRGPSDIIEIQAAITERGQTTVPAAIRKMLSLGKRDRIVFRGMADGTVVIAKEAIESGAADPLIGSFLDFLAGDMTNHPQRIRPVPARLVRRATRLVEGLAVDIDDALLDDDT